MTIFNHQNPDADEPNPPSIFDSLYCSEEDFEQDEVRAEIESNDINCKASPFPVLLEQDLYWESEELVSLFSKEESNLLSNKIETDPCLALARREAVEWILKVVEHYSFSPLTAVLTVSYFDRFLLNFDFQVEKPWMTQLAAVTCLSLAAKVEETHVPLLLDFQVEGSRFLFEAKTIQRMELLVLTTLQWKMNPVTPLSFLDYITRRLGLKDNLCWEFLRRSEGIVLSIISDSRFMCYRPAVIATATMLHTVDSVKPCLAIEYKAQLLGILWNDKHDKVDECYKLMLDVAWRGQSDQSKKRKYSSNPGSPTGVMDAFLSNDNSNDSWAVVATTPSSPEPILKKSKGHEKLMQKLKNAATGVLRILPG